MLAYMPKIYPDELIFSWLSRWVGHCSCSVVTRYRAISTEFAVKFDEDIKAALYSQYGDIDAFLWKHTMLPYYVRFRDEHTRYTALSWMKRKGKLDISNYMLLNQAMIRHIKYCPMCAVEDRVVYGEAYYHRSHQLWDVSMCVKHSCKLLSTCIKVGSATLSPPDSTITNETAIDASYNKRQASYSKYVVAAFKATDIDTDIDYVESLHRLSAGCTLWNSRLVDYDRIVRNLHEIYAECGISIPNAQLVQTVVDTTRIDTRVILLLLYMEQAC